MVICLLVVNVALLFTARKSSSALAEATVWAQPYSWRSATCKVLAAGVTCVDRDTSTTCGGFGGNGTLKRTSTGAVLWDFNDIATCPGAYWCAKEGDPCRCDGKVTYSTELFNGTGYTLVNEAMYSIDVTGEIKCGLGVDGQPLTDPHPYVVKHCWCMPRIILQQLHPAGNTAVRTPYQCDTDLAVAKAELAQQRRLDDRTEDTEEDEEEVDADSEPREGASKDGRRLTSHSPRRRRTYHYTPWALVEVPPKEDDGFGDRENQVPVIACAYEFGKAEDSKGDYTSDGPSESWLIGDNLWGARQAALKAQQWATSIESQCFVRTQGAVGKDSCAVALNPLTELAARREGGATWAWRGFFGILVVSLCCFVVACLVMFDVADDVVNYAVNRAENKGEAADLLLEQPAGGGHASSSESS